MSVSFTFSDQEISTIGLNYLINQRNMQDRPYRVAEAFKSASKNDAAGHTMIIPWDKSRHSNTTQLVHGYEDVDLTARPIMTPGQDTYFACIAPILWSLMDERKNSGREQKINTVERLVGDTDRRLHREYERQLMLATESKWSDLNSLNGDDDANGFLEAAAAGSQNNTVHGVSKSTYAALPGFQNQFGDIQGDFSTNGINVLRLQHLTLMEISENMGTRKAFASINGANNYLTAVQANERYSSGGADAVATKVVIAGVEYELSHNMPNNGTVTGSAGDNEWSFLVLDMGAVYMRFFPGVEFNMTEFRELSGNRVKAAYIEVMGQLAIEEWRSQLLIIGGDTY